MNFGLSKSCLAFLLFALVLGANSGTDVQAGQSIAEFREYVSGKLGSLSDTQVDSIIERADADQDGEISDAEFDNRMAVVRAVMTGKKDESSGKLKSTAQRPEPVAHQVVKIDSLAPTTDAPVLLITADELAESWVPFAKWKTQNGKLTKIVTVGQIANDFSADNIQEKIRLCVRKHIDDHATRWVILGGDCQPGDQGLVPGGHSTVHAQERSGIPTDIVYLSPTNWDADNDGVYGEFKDDRDAITYPDGSVGMGRIPVRTPADVVAFTDKVINYESNYPASGFAGNMIYTCTESPAYAKVRNSWDGYISKVWSGNMGRFFTDETPWDADDTAGSYQLSADHLVELFNKNSTGKMHIHGHGHLPAWVLESSVFDKRHVKQLTNKNAYPLITTVSCHTGEYDSKVDPSIVEQLLRVPNAGSVAIVAPIRKGRAHFSDRSDVRLMITEGKLDGTTITMTRYWMFGLEDGDSTGHAMMKAKQAMANEASSAVGYHLCICELNLLGDPTLDMRAKDPRIPNLLSSVRKLASGTEITIATDAPGSTVCLWNPKETYQVAIADDDGQAKFLVQGDPNGHTVSVSGRNLNSVSESL